MGSGFSCMKSNKHLVIMLPANCASESYVKSASLLKDSDAHVSPPKLTLLTSSSANEQKQVEDNDASVFEGHIDQRELLRYDKLAANSDVEARRVEQLGLATCKLIDAEHDVSRVSNDVLSGSNAVVQKHFETTNVPLLNLIEDFDGANSISTTGVRHAPKITYSHSEDRLLTCEKGGQRAIFPGLPYSPYHSPQQNSLQTLCRQPTKECRSVSVCDVNGYKQLNNYRLQNEIGRGTFGIVKLAYNQDDDNHYAMKILSKKRIVKSAGLFRRPLSPGQAPPLDPLQRVYREIAIQKKLCHPNIVKLVEVLDDPEHDNLYMVFELVEKGQVMELPTDEPLRNELAWSYFRDTLMGLEYLHYQKIIHRDIKPSNLLLGDDDHVKITDFGVSNEFSGEDVLLSNTAGSPAFMAPECVREGQKSFQGRALDIWSLGVTLYCFLIGKLPFDRDPKIALYHAIVHEDLKFPPSTNIDKHAIHLITQMLKKNSTERITLPQIKEHAWVTQVGQATPLPSEAVNCTQLIEVTDEEVAVCVQKVPKLETLIFVKRILRRRSFKNPDSSEHSDWVGMRCRSTPPNSEELSNFNKNLAKQ